ncbi:DUF305 domain-containing protein [Actinoplanes sp. GCM10030250]|uniref:DUF305 domain-containing protein n=1 Tax=Actinoplanes sp. GCM10030250 TaxID=3273376 RepID=UPI00360B41DC
MDGPVITRGAGGPVRRAALALIALLTAVCTAACSGAPAEKQAPPPAFNETDVMFLQMGLAQITEGEQVAQRAEQRAAGAEVRAVAAELREQWQTESGTMQRWLLGWERPMQADPSAGLHAGHGDLHSLREEDVAALDQAKGADFDRTAVALLLGNLHNSVETMRMESAGGAYPPARSLADQMAAARQQQIQRLLAVASAG